jgi:PAS domain S-box-containing protein
MTASDDERDALHAEIARLRASEAELTARAATAEQELHASRALLAAAIENLPFDFWARDADGVCSIQNATARANWGDLLHLRVEDSNLPPDVLARWLDNNRRVLAGEIVRGDFEYAKDGETRHIHNILAPIRVDDAIVGTLGVNIDLTELRRALLALRESREKLRIAADSAGIGFWSWDPARDEVSWEPTVCAIFGVPAGTSPGGRAGYLVYVHPDDREGVGARSRSGSEFGQWEREYRIVRADGEVRWVMVNGTAVDEGNASRIVGVIIDVTERKQRDEQLRQAQKLDAVGQLTAGIAHNFNNMLMGMLPNLEVAAQRAPDHLVPLLAGATDSARRAADLVRKLMTYSGRTRPAAPTVEDLGLLAARAVELCRTTFDKRITFEQSYDARARSRIDATQIEQVLLNLLLNARDALESPQIQAPRVSVSVDVVGAGESELMSGRHRDHVRVRVCDNGVGMDEATMRRIYEPFFTTKAPGKGTGLGLATTHAILHDHGGFVSCESTMGKGTTFSFYLPLEASVAVREPEVPPVEPPRGTETVLIVDDEPAVRRVVALILESAGYATRQAASGIEALALLQDPEIASKVALLILDVSMPGPPRHDLRTRLRELTQARIVYLTGFALDAADAEDTVLEKPVTRARILQTVRQVLDGGG